MGGKWPFGLGRYKLRLLAIPGTLSHAETPSWEPHIQGRMVVFKIK